jgi:hypothetical protein
MILAQTKPILTMKKILLTFAAVACLSIASFAQGRFSVGAELALPQGDFGDGFGTGFGASVRYESPINDNISWMGTIGYIAFGEKDNSGVTLSQIPIMAGAKYYFTESFGGFYAGAELGLSMGKVKFDGGDDSSTDFGFAPQVGYHLGVIDISARYLIVSYDGDDANSVGLRVAYVFGGK